MRILHKVRDRLRLKTRFLVLDIVANLLLWKATILKVRKHSIEADFQIWICFSTMHLILARAAASDAITATFFYGKTLSLYDEAILDIETQLFSVAPLLRQLIKALFKSSAIQIFVPHISPIVFPDDVRSFLWKLWENELLGFYDDGMSSISRQTHLFKDGFIPKEAKILAWNYSFLESGKYYNLVSLSKVTIFTGEAEGSKPLYNKSSFLKLPDLINKSTLILASKGLDYSLVHQYLQSINLKKMNCTYVPHYQSNKNDPRFLDGYDVFCPSCLELDVPLLLKDKRWCLIFGITSTATFLLELVRQGKIPAFDAVFAGNPDLVGSLGIEEFSAYTEVLKFYNVKILVFRDSV